MKKTIINYLIALIGIILLGIGIYLIKSTLDPQGLMKTLPYICIGLGCGIFGHGMGNLISHKIIQTNPNVKKQVEIEQKDERNITISNCAKSKAYDLMTFVFGALMIVFAFMGVNSIAVLLLVFCYLFVHGYAIYYRFKYSKEM